MDLRVTALRADARAARSGGCGTAHASAAAAGASASTHPSAGATTAHAATATAASPAAAGTAHTPARSGPLSGWSCAITSGHDYLLSDARGKPRGEHDNAPKASCAVKENVIPAKADPRPARVRRRPGRDLGRTGLAVADRNPASRRSAPAGGPGCTRR